MIPCDITLKRQLRQDSNADELKQFCKESAENDDVREPLSGVTKSLWQLLPPKVSDKNFYFLYGQVGLESFFINKWNSLKAVFFIFSFFMIKKK